MSEEQLVRAATQALAHGDLDDDGKWSKQEFMQVLCTSTILIISRYFEDSGGEFYGCCRRLIIQT